MELMIDPLDYHVTAMAARALRGDMEKEMALGSVIALVALEILSRHGLDEVAHEDLYPMLEEIQRTTDLEPPGANGSRIMEESFKATFSRHLEKMLERKVYGKPAMS